MRKRIEIGKSFNSMEDAVQKAAVVLKDGGIILYPTDTLYGLGVDTNNISAIRKLYNLKNRNFDKTMSIIVSGIEMAEQHAVFDKKARLLAKKFWPGPLTLILPRKNILPSELSGREKSIGIRIPGNKFCINLLRTFGRPITSTSANVSGTKPQKSVNCILSQFGNKANEIGLIVSQEDLTANRPSTIVDVSSRETKIIREGVISASEILK